MSPEEFEKKLQAKAKEIQNYALTRFPSTAGNIALRFINGNFRAGGFQGQSFERWKKSNKGKGTTLVDTAALRAANYYTTQPGQTTLKNNRPYAKVHNEGFEGTVTVKEHARNKYSKTKVGTGKFTKKGKERTKTMTVKSGESNVKAHSRKMKIPKRQFMPTNQNDSPVLNNAIQREVARDINKIML
jgi:phage gpG-like protein